MEIIILDSNIEAFINSFEKITRAKIFKSIKLLEMFGYKLRLPHTKKITENIFELRICGKIEIRLFYIFKNNSVIIIHGFTKKTKKIPKKEIDTATDKTKEFALV